MDEVSQKNKKTWEYNEMEDDDMKLRIRKANKNDVEVVYKLICQLVGTEPGTISIKAFKDIYHENLNSNNKECFIAEHNGIACGFICVSYDLRLSECCRVAVIDELVVDRDKRNLGIGTALVKQIIQIAKSKGCSLFEVSTNLRRTDTHHFYEKIGFIKNGYRFGFDGEAKFGMEGIR